MTKSKDFLYGVGKINIYLMLVVFAVPLLLFADNAAAKGIDKARTYYQEGKYKKAGKLWKKIGNGKNDKGEAHYLLAGLYKDGLGYEKNDVQASIWYRKSAEKNYVPAMYALGALHYRDGDLSVRSVRGAIQWWERAARAGHSTSLLELANLYLEDDERNILAAKRYGRLAALAGEQAGLFVVKRVEDEIIKMNILGARRLANIKPDIYTIELSSFLGFYQAWEFVVLNNISNARIHRNIYSDFVVTLGEFSTSDAAFSRISQLPDSIIALRPRPRELRVIQRELIPSKSTFAEYWIYQRDPNKYTVTLFSADARLDALDFVDEYGLEEAAIYHSKLGQWIVNAGIFNDAALAQGAASRLPQKMKDLGPVVNSYQAIHNDMMRSRKEITQQVASLNRSRQAAKPKQRLETASVDNNSAATSVPNSVTKAAAKPVQNVQTTRKIQPAVASTSPVRSKGPKGAKPITRKQSPSRTPNRVVKRGKWSFNSGAAKELTLSSSKSRQPSKVISTGPIADELKASERWLFSQKARPYTLQLVTTSDAKSIMSLLKRKRRELGVNVYLFDQHEPRYFYLLYGEFTTSDEARKHAAQLNLRGTVVVSLENHQFKRCEKYSSDATKRDEYQSLCR